MRNGTVLVKEGIKVVIWSDNKDAATGLPLFTDGATFEATEAVLLASGWRIISY